MNMELYAKFQLICAIGGIIYFVIAKIQKKDTSLEQDDKKFLGPLLFFGIILIPFLAIVPIIRKNYSNKAKWFSGCFCILFLVILYGNHDWEEDANSSFGKTNSATSNNTSSTSNNANSTSNTAVSLPMQQQFLIDIINDTKSKIKEDFNSAKRKRIWIEASNKLCSSEDFDAKGIKSDFRGYVKSIIAHDDGSVGIEIQLDDLYQLDRNLKVYDSSVNKSLIPIIEDTFTGY